MISINKGIINGLTQDQVDVMISHSFDKNQLEEMKAGFGSGLSEKQVKLFADPKYDWQQMKKLRTDMESQFSQRWSKVIKKREKTTKRKNREIAR
jgi:ABC-type uncharacterized transport system substrate-binding protein